MADEHETETNRDCATCGHEERQHVAVSPYFAHRPCFVDCGGCICENFKPAPPPAPEPEPVLCLCGHELERHVVAPMRLSDAVPGPAGLVIHGRMGRCLATGCACAEWALFVSGPSEYAPTADVPIRVSLLASEPVRVPQLHGIDLTDANAEAIRRVRAMLVVLAARPERPSFADFLAAFDRLEAVA